MLQWFMKKSRGAFHRLLGRTTESWSRVVMNRSVETFLETRRQEGPRVLEISGDLWKDAGWDDYQSWEYPDFDICAELETEETFDLILLEQVLEHVQFPARAIENVHRLLRPGGWLYVSTPFLIRVHWGPKDYWRWTPDGLEQHLVDCGFTRELVETHSWGNKACLVANLDDWQRYVPRLHSLENDDRFPLVVWAYARKEA